MWSPYMDRNGSLANISLLMEFADNFLYSAAGDWQVIL
jgi:hypothetical protein